MEKRKPLADNVKDAIPLQSHWEDFVDWLLAKGELFAQKYRYSLSARIFNVTFDIQEKIIRARFAREKSEILRELHVDMEILDSFFRRCYNKKLFSHSAYEYACNQMKIARKMLSGWRKYSENKASDFCTSM